MSVGVVNKTTGERIPTAGTPLDKVGDLSLLHTTAKSNAVAAINEVADEVATKQDALTFDNAPTKNSNNPVKSGGVYSALAGKVNTENGKGLSTNDYSDTEKAQVATNTEDIDQLKSGLTNVNVALAVPENTGKNVLPMTLSGIKSANTSGTWANNVYTDNDVAFTVQTDNDGRITGINISGTASARTNFYLCNNVNVNQFSGMILNGCPDNGGSSTYFLTIAQTSSPWTDYTDIGDGVNIGQFSASNGAIYITIKQDVAASDLTFYPMIRDARITDATYTPYIPSVESRIEAIERNDFSDATNIKDYNTTDNMFIATNDGYIVAETTNSVIVRLYGSANAYVNIKIDVSNNNYLYVKKGMKLYVFSNTNSESVYFIPLT